MNTPARSRLDGMSFALGSSRAVAVTADVFALEDHPQFALVPGTKPFFQGFLKYASRMVPCFDLQIFCGLPPSPHEKGSCLISQTANGDLAAIWVKDVCGVRGLGDGALTSNPEIPSALAPYVLNSCGIGGEPHLLIDIQKLVTDLSSDKITLY